VKLKITIHNRVYFKFFVQDDQSLSLGELKTLLSNRNTLKKVEKIVKYSSVDSKVASSLETVTAATSTAKSSQDLATSHVEQASNEDLRSIRRRKLFEELKKRTTSTTTTTTTRGSNSSS
jgi:hypothetical protein